MSDQQHAVLGGGQDIVDDLVRHARIQVRRGLFEDQYRRAREQRPSQHDSLPLPADAQDRAQRRPGVSRRRWSPR